MITKINIHCLHEIATKLHNYFSVCVWNYNQTHGVYPQLVCRSLMFNGRQFTMVVFLSSVSISFGLSNESALLTQNNFFI